MRAAKVADLIPDGNNANKGTERGAFMLRQSVEQAGVGRGIVVDRHGNILGGNKTHATIGELGLDDLIIVATDGRQLVVTQRTDLDLNAEPGTPEHDKARTLALADNRANEVNLSWVPEALADYAEVIDLDDWFKPEEQSVFFDNAQAGEWAGGEQGSEAGDDDRASDATAASQQPTGIKTPLAIALTSAELKKWNAFKEECGAKGDTNAFLKLLELAEGV